jgi:hypothetical protein
MPIDVVIDNGITTGGCRLICEAGGEKELFIQVTSGDYPAAGDVRLTWTYSRALYAFKSKIISQRVLDSNFMLLEQHMRTEAAEEYPLPK